LKDKSPLSPGLFSGRFRKQQEMWFRCVHTGFGSCFRMRAGEGGRFTREVRPCVERPKKPIGRDLLSPAKFTYRQRLPKHSTLMLADFALSARSHPGRGITILFRGTDRPRARQSGDPSSRVCEP
jgi:hypothetical protein